MEPTASPAALSGSNVAPAATPGAASAPDLFPELVRSVKQAGLLRPRRRAYVAMFALNGGLTVLVACAFVVLGPSWWQMLTAVVAGLVSTQLAFIGHDAGHRQIFARKRANDVVGYVHGCVVGMSFGAWVDKHNRHHAHPNHLDEDPDIDIPVLAFSADQVEGRRGLVRWIAAHQAFLFFPLLLLEGWSLHVTSAQAALRGEVRRPRLELALLAAHAAVYLGALLWVLTPLQAVVFALVHQGVWGLSMGLAFAPNHKGMPIIESGRRLDHLHKQIVTSRNVRGGPLVSYLLGGLNHQIEHHLFPRMPRPNLRRAQLVVSAFCAEHALPYTQTDAVDSYAQVLRHLHAVGAPLRRPGRWHDDGAVAREHPDRASLGEGSRVDAW
jgi:fatty acid desaturase